MPLPAPDETVRWFLGLLLGLLLAGVPDISGQQPPVPGDIRISALFDSENDQPIEAAFNHACNMVNDDRSTLIRSTLSCSTHQITPSDSFKASKIMCNMMKSGLVAVFGPQADATANHIQSISDTFHVPHVETRWHYSSENRPFSINIRPHPSVLGQAYASFLQSFNWRSFVVIYENEESLVRLQEVLKFPKRYEGVKLSLHQLDPFSDDYRPMLKQIKNSTDTQKFHIILDCSFEKIERVLMNANEIGMINDYYNFFITSLDLERIDLSPFKNIAVNITGYRMVDPTLSHVQQYIKVACQGSGRERDHCPRGRDHPLFSDNVLMYDAVHVLAKSLDDLSRMSGFNPMPINCMQGGSQWRDGQRIIYNMRNMRSSPAHGLTGEITFDEDGFRTDFKLELLEKRRDLMMKTGVWEPGVGLNFTLTQTQTDELRDEKLQNKTLRISTVTNKPFVMNRREALLMRENSPESYARMSFEERYEGYVIDLVRALSVKLKFKYKFHIVGDGKYGSYDKDSGTWNGIIRELQEQKADLGIIDLSITSIRQMAVDFTMPYMSTGVGILYKKKKPPPQNLFSFASPLSPDVWIYMITLYVVISVLMFMLARVTPNEWDNPHPCKDDPDELETMFTVGNALWFSIGSLLCQGSDILPKAIPTRMVASIWWFFTLIMISSYTANLAAFLTAQQMETAVNSADDLAKQTKIKYGTYCCGSSNSFFKSSTIPTYQKLNAFMESAKPSVYTKTGNQEGLDRVLKEDGAYAFFMEGASIEYNVERNCELTQIGGLLDSKGYGIALPKGSPFTGDLTRGVLALQEDGELSRLKIKWWKEGEGAGSCGAGAAATSAQMGLANIGGVFIVLLGGMIVSCIIAVVEYAWGKRMLLQDENESLMSNMWQDFKFAVDFRAGDTKPVEDKTKDKSEAGTKSIGKEESHYGEIGNDAAGAGGGVGKNKGGKAGGGNNDDSAYAVFNDSFSQKSKSKG